jgi:hypothetical protein
MKRSVRLSLKKETLSPLTTDDMRAVAGGASEASCYTCVECVIGRIDARSLDLTACCQGIPTFHRAGGAAC